MLFRQCCREEMDLFFQCVHWSIEQCFTACLRKSKSQGTLWIAFMKPLDWHFVMLSSGWPLVIPGIIPPAESAILYDLTRSAPLQGLLLPMWEGNQAQVFGFQHREVQDMGLSPFCKSAEHVYVYAGGYVGNWFCRRTYAYLEFALCWPWDGL